MANLSDFHQEGALLDHTPSSNVSAGSILDLGALSVFSSVTTASGIKGGVAVKGVIAGPWVGLGANAGDNVYWDANGTPQGGSGDGAFTPNAAAGDWWVGTLVEPVAAASATANIALNVVNPNLPAWANKDHVSVASDTSWTASTHNGKVLHVLDDGGNDTTITLPVGVAGMEAIIVNDEVDGELGIIVDLNGNETIEGNLTIALTKTAINTQSTSIRGDYLHLICETIASLWVCTEKRGIWVTSV